MYLVVSCHTTISICLVFISLLWCQIVLSFFFFFFVFNNFAFYFLRKIWQMRSFFWFLSFLLLHFDLCWWLSRNFFRFFFFFSFFASFSLEWRCFKVSHKINTKILFKFFICMLGAQVIEFNFFIFLIKYAHYIEYFLLVSCYLHMWVFLEHFFFFLIIWTYMPI